MGGDKGGWVFGGIPSGSSSGREERRTILSNIQGLVNRVQLSAPDNGLDVLRLAEFDLHDRLM